MSSALYTLGRWAFRARGLVLGVWIAVQGSPVDVGGYYRPDAELVAGVMRPSQTFNGIIDSL